MVRSSLSVVVGFGLLLAQGCGSGSLPSAGPLDPGIEFKGIWDSNWGQLKLLQNAGHVHGTYKGFRNGSLSGDVKGNLFVFRWTQMESQQWGRGYLKMAPDGQRMEGRWGYKKNYSNGGRWWANRAER